MSSTEINPDPNILKYLSVRGVVGFSKSLRKRIQDGKEVEEVVIRFYVSEKIPEAELRDSDILPKEIDGIPVDVVQLKQPTIFPKSPKIPKAFDVLRTNIVRPIIPGTSIGNYGITAGTLGWYAQKDGDIYADSNAHVFHTDPNSLTAPTEMNIVQPGKYDGGVLQNKVGQYAWHFPIVSDAPVIPSTCPVAKVILSALNTAYTSAGRKTRFTTYVKMDDNSKQISLNNLDYAVAKLDSGIDIELKTFDFEVINKYKLVGKLFAGSDDATIAFKVKYQIANGYTPYKVDIAEVMLGDLIRKSGRTTGDTTGTVTDTSAIMKISYGNFTALFDDVFILGPMSGGGDSGSSMWKLTE
jgi:hypothetical protein